MKSLDSHFKLNDASVWISTDESDAEAPAFLCQNYDLASVEAQGAIAKFSKPFRAIIKAKAMTPQQDREIMIKTFVACSLKDWRNISLDGESALSFTPENALDVFKRYPKIFLFVSTEAASGERYKLDEDDIKN